MSNKQLHDLGSLSVYQGLAYQQKIQLFALASMLPSARNPAPQP